MEPSRLEEKLFREHLDHKSEAIQRMTLEEKQKQKSEKYHINDASLKNESWGRIIQYYGSLLILPNLYFKCFEISISIFQTCRNETKYHNYYKRCKHI